MEVIVKEVGVKALGEHLPGQEQHGGEADGDKGAVCEKLSDSLGCGTLFLRLGFGLDALLVEFKGHQQHQHGDDRHDDHALDDRGILHVGDGLAVFAQHHIPGLIQALGIGKACDQQHGDGAQRRADGAEGRELVALRGVGSDHRGQRPVGDLQNGVDHAEEDVGHGGVNAGGGLVSLLAHAGPLDKHEDRRDGQRCRHIQQPRPVAPVAAGLHRVADAAHDGVVDRIPHACKDEHEHDEQRA